MLEPFADAFIHKRHRKVAHHRVEQLVELRDVHHFLVFDQLIEGCPNLRAEGIQIQEIALRLVEQILAVFIPIKRIQGFKNGKQGCVDGIHLRLTQLLLSFFREAISLLKHSIKSGAWYAKLLV